MHAITQAQIDILRGIVEKVSTKTSVALGTNMHDIDDFLSYFHTLYCDDTRVQQRLSSSAYILVLDHQASDDGAPITYEQLAGFVFTGQRIIFVSKSLVFVKAAMCNEISTFHAAQLSETEKNLVLFVDGLIYFPFINGKQIARECNLQRPGEPAYRGQVWHRPFSQLQQLLDEHLQDQLRDERVVKYWKNKPLRILASGSEKTEQIFHRTVFYWLQSYISDALDVTAEPRGFGQNAYDIKVVAPFKKFCIEIKWLGINENKTEYDVSQISVGLAQMLEYLNKDSGIFCAYVVYYDGRSKEKHQNERGYKVGSKHANCGEPILLFLESETPSVTAKSAFGK